jgi:hypothetical protein
MDFINQVKKLKEVTKSPEVKSLCESFLRGESVSKDQLIASINEHNNSEMTQNESPSIVNHIEAIRKEEAEVSKRAAEALMESWSGLGKNTSSNSGSYLPGNEMDDAKSEKLLESISSLEDKDGSAISFIESQGIKNLGVMEAISKLKESSIYEYPKAKVLFEQYQNLILNKNLPEFVVVNNFIAELESFNWENSVRGIAEELKNKAKKYSREIEVSKVLESIKNSGSYAFYSELSETLNSWLVSEEKSNGLLVRDISKYSFNPVVRNLINFLNINEKEDNRFLEIPIKAQGESSVSRVYSPVLFENGRTFFHIGNSVFEASEKELVKLTERQVSELPSDYLKLVEITKKPHVAINENGISIRFGKKIVKLVEEGENVAVYLGKDKLRFSDNIGLAKILGLESSSYFGVNESEVVNDTMFLYNNYSDIVELDFAKSINSNIYEGVGVNMFKWNNQIYLQKINQTMNENSIFKVSGTQAVSMVKSYLKYDISEGLTEFLEGENKLKSIMVNDRNKVLENISKVENEINKINSLLESSPLYKSSNEILTAKSALENELNVLREKWNQINTEISKIEEEISFADKINVSEDEKFNIGDFIKVKESGETGKIISVDGTSGRYTILLDNGKTDDFLVNEISDLEEALSQAADKNEKDAKEEEEAEEVKESNNLNKSDLSIEEQKTLLKNFADSHSFSKAPKGEQDSIEMELDSLHGYNITMNEAKKKDGNDDLAKAPGNNKKEKGKVEGEKLLADSPKTKDKTNFDAEDADGEKYEIGYNLREGKVENEGDLAEAPDNEAKSNAITKLKGGSEKIMNLAEAPGKEGDIDFKGDVEDMGYNLTESETLKKN